MQRKEKQKQEEIADYVYLLQNNIHYKNQCIVDVENGIFEKRT